MSQKKILVYGYGNPGRQDDGLGIAMADTLKKWAEEKGFAYLNFDQNYQLNIEDASKIMDFDLVIFADASIETIDSFRMDEVAPDLKTEFSMHSVSPSFVLGLSREIATSSIPKVYLLHIKGYEFNFMQEMTAAAKENLIAAENYLKQFLQEHLDTPTPKEP
jgi:hydrogenase maturation protease